MKEYKIFLAASSELADDRKEFANYIGRLNNNWAKRGIFLKVVMWEHFLDTMSATRLQDEYNKAVVESDIFVLLYHTKVGEFTAEEFTKAFGKFQETGKPKIYTYFKTAEVALNKIPKKDVLSLYAFQEQLKILGHFQTEYKNPATLLLHFRAQLDELIASGYLQTNEERTTAQNTIPKILGNPPFFPEVFLGREIDLETIHQKLFEAENLLLLVNGEGGIGKTTLAAVYYQNYADQYQHLAWVFAEKSLLEAILTLAPALQLKFGEKEPTDARFQRVLNRMRQLTKPCLLVIDNANNLTDLEHHYADLKSCPNFHVLLTTRITEFEQAPTHKITPLADETAKRLFKKYYKKHQDSEDAILFNIFDAIGKNTLVIELLAKNLFNLNRLKAKYQLPHLLADLQNKGLLAIQNKAIRIPYQAKAGSLRQATPEAIIAAMYDLGNLSEPEKRLMSVFAVLPAENIAFEVLETLLPNTEDLDDTLLLLAQKGWLDFNELENSFKVSPVVQEVTTNKSNKIFQDCEELLDNISEKLSFEGAGYLKNTTYQEAVNYAIYAESIVNTIKENSSEISIICERTGKFHETTGDLIKALSLYEKSYQIDKHLLECHPNNSKYKNFVAISLSRLGSTHSSLGNLQQALHFFEDFNQLEKELYESYPHNVSFKNGLAISYERLGSMHRSLGNSEKALDFFEDYNQLKKELYDSYPQNVSFKNGLAISYEKLGILNRDLDDFENALQFFEKEIKLKEELYEHYPQNVNFKNGLALAYQWIGWLLEKNMDDFAQAKPYYEKSKSLLNELATQFPAYIQFKKNLDWVNKRIQK